MIKELLLEQIKIRNRINEIKELYPLSLAKLWLPYCHRYDGLADKSPRKIGCGNPMKRIKGNMWRCESCDITEQRTAQSDPLFDLGSEATSVFGGNRAGKSDLGAQLSVATAAGSQEWWVKEWLKNNQLPNDLIQSKPSIVVASALSYSDAISYVRPKIEKYLPSNCKFKHWSANQRASVTLPNGGKILSYSADSGRKKYQGLAAKMIWLDEEHEKSIFEEAMLRVVSENGFCFLTFTPLLGLTWPNELFITNNQNPDSFKYHMLSGLDNPYVSSVKMRRAVSHLSEASQQSRLYGKFTNQTGLVYPEINQSIHVVQKFVVPPDWEIYYGIDFGVHNFAAICVAYDSSTDVLYVIDEYFNSGETTLFNGNALKKRFSKYKSPTFVICDSAQKDSRMLIARHCGLSNKPAPKHIGVINSINLVKSRLAPDVDGVARLKIFNHCKNLLKEFRLYSWKKNSSGKDEVKKQFDHGLDALRYLIAFIYRMLSHS